MVQFLSDTCSEESNGSVAVCLWGWLPPDRNHPNPNPRGK